MPKKWVICRVRKLDPSERDHVLEEDEFFEISGGADEGETAGVVGEPAVFAANLDEERAEAYRAASNLFYIEGDATDHAVDDTQGAYPGGVEERALRVHQMLNRRAEDVITGVTDTGLQYRYRESMKSELLGQWYWVTGTADDSNGHGTWCSFAAHAPGSMHISMKSLDDQGSGSRSVIVKTMYFFYERCAKEGTPGVLSMSLGGSGYSQAYEDAAKYGLSKGCLTVAAAGNDNGEVSAPGNCQSVICVAAFDYALNRASFSNYGPEVDVAAMGVSVEGQGLDGRYSRMSGTSMATPIVARAVACLLALEPDVGKVRQALYAGAQDTSAPAVHEGHGVVKTGASAKKLQPDPKEPDPDVFYRVQLGYFSERSNADALARELKEKGYETYVREAS